MDRIHIQLGGEAGNFLAALDGPSPVSIRQHPEKKNSPGNDPVLWCASGKYIAQRPVFTLDPLFHAGCYYVQEASSMFLEQVFRQLGLDKQPLNILDACAAPGGKSTHVASLMNSESILVSNEAVSSRVSMLKENLVKWGAPNVVISKNDPADFSGLGNFFDVTIVDAPCSGEGLFRKDPSAAQEWSEAACNLCASRQQRIIHDLVPALKPGGLFIYCTCTFNPAENQDNVEWMIQEYQMECIPLQLAEDWGIVTNNNGSAISYSFFPHRTKGEGFFISVLKKKAGEYAGVQKRRIKNRKRIWVNQQFKETESWIDNSNKAFKIFREGDFLFAIDESRVDDVDLLSTHLSLVQAALLLGEIKGEKVIPSHELALSTLLNQNAFPKIELDLQDALKYLRKENFEKKPEQKGWTLVTYQQQPLGWINALGTRVNNYYPTAWRIRMTG